MTDRVGRDLTPAEAVEAVAGLRAVGGVYDLVAEVVESRELPRAIESAIAEGGMTAAEIRGLVTSYLLDRSRRVLGDRQKWQETVAKAARAHGFTDYCQASEWYVTLPEDPATERGRARWLAEQRAIATRPPAAGPIPEDRALAIAIAALERQDAQESELAADIRRLHSNGLNDREIAERLAVTERTVFRQRHDRMNLPANSQGGSSHPYVPRGNPRKEAA